MRAALEERFDVYLAEDAASAMEQLEREILAGMGIEDPYVIA